MNSVTCVLKHSCTISSPYIPSLLTLISEFATEKTFSTLQMSYLAAIFHPVGEDMLA